MKFPTGSAGAGREREEMEVGKGLRGKEVVGFAKFRFRFAGEADHDIRAESECWARGFEEGSCFVGVVPGAVATMHAAENGVGAGLQRQVGVSSYTRGRAEFAYQTDQL